MWQLYLGVWNLWPLQCWWKNANNWRCDKKCFTTLARWDLHIWHSTQSEKTGIYLCTLMSPLLRSASGVYWPQHVAVWWRRRGVTNDSPWYFRGTFCSTRNSENFETGTNCMEISCESFQKIWKWLNFWKANHSFESSRKSGRKSILETKSLFTSQDCPLFREIWNGWCIHHKKFLEIQTRFFIRWKVPQVASLGIPGPITSPCKNQIDWIYWFYLFLCRHTYQSGSKLAKWNDSSSFCEEHGGLCKNQCSL